MGYIIEKIGRSGDTIEIKLRDSLYQKYYEGKANVNNRAEMKLLERELSDKGVKIKFPTI